MSAVYYTTFESPVGTLLLGGDADALRLVSFESSKYAAPPQADWKQDKAPFAEVIRQLQAYFRGELKEFNLPLALEERSSNFTFGTHCAPFPMERLFPTYSSRSASAIPKPCAQ